MKMNHKRRNDIYRLSNTCRYEDGNILMRTVNTSWPHRELQEFYVPVSYNPAVEETD
jgi:hypothetical protein